jgi:hypothetical protein
MHVGLSLKVIWYDRDVIELRISASNGAFAGVTDLYEGYGDLEKAAAQLSGFPQNPSDEREVVFGTFDRKGAGGGVRLRFHCVDNSGHAYADVIIASGRLEGGMNQNVALAMPVEAAALDRFVEELEKLEADLTSTARLESVSTPP